MSDVAGPNPITEIIRTMMEDGRTGAEIGAAVEEYIAQKRAWRLRIPSSAPRKRSSTKHLRRHDNDWWALRWSVFQRDGFRCHYCDADVRDNPHCDHFIPLARGGTNEMINLVTACAPCNLSKGAKLFEEWAAEDH